MGGVLHDVNLIPSLLFRSHFLSQQEVNDGQKAFNQFGGDWRRAREWRTDGWTDGRRESRPALFLFTDIDPTARGGEWKSTGFRFSHASEGASGGGGGGAAAAPRSSLFLHLAAWRRGKKMDARANH
jgi:hypothetical protein